MNFTVADTLGTLAATAALVPIMFAPGYVAGWGLDVFGFRRRRLLLRLILAIPLSIAICPIITYLLARFFPPALWVLYGGSTAACLLLLARQVRKVKVGVFSRQIWAASGLSLLWVVIAISLLVDLQIGDKLYSSLAAYDHSTRVAMMASIARHVPPTNPFFAHPAVPLRYHYLWILLCSLPMKIFHLSARHLVYAGVIWCGAGLMGAVALGLKFLLREETAIARKTFIAVALLCVTGLDIVPTLFIAGVGHWWLADMEWWNDAPITSWASSLLWVPHNIAALIACFAGFLLLRHAAGESHRPATIAALIAGTAFASAAGMSVYVAFTFAVAVALWLLVLVTRKRWKEMLMFAGAGAVAALLALPFLYSLQGPGGGTAFAQLAIRRFLGAGAQNSPATTALNLGFLPFGYALELGFFVIVGVLRLRQIRRGTIAATPNELAGWTLVGASFLVGTFLQSSTITTNDLGIRCFLPAQLVLLLWGAAAVNRWKFESDPTQSVCRPWTRAALQFVLFLGILGTLYEVTMIRWSPVIYDRWGNAGLSWMDPDWNFGKRTYALRSVYEAVNAQLPSSAVIQHNPATKSFVAHQLYAAHDAVAGGPDCGIAFGGEVRKCEQRVGELVALFANRDSPQSVCQDYGIDVLVVKDTDLVWKDQSSWVWSERPLAANNHVRAFRCGTATAGVNR